MDLHSNPLLLTEVIKSFFLADASGVAYETLWCAPCDLYNSLFPSRENAVLWQMNTSAFLRSKKNFVEFKPEINSIVGTLITYNNKQSTSEKSPFNSVAFSNQFIKKYHGESIMPQIKIHISDLQRDTSYA